MRLLLTFLTLTSIIILFSCTKDSNNIDKELIIGIWISADKTDTLDFVDNMSFYKSSAAMNYDQYVYELLSDSIKIGYGGKQYIAIVPTIHSYKLSGDKLTIDYSNKQCYGFDLKRIEYIRK